MVFSKYQEETKVSKAYSSLFWLFTLVALFFSSRYNYLLFHSLSELFSIVIAGGIFLIGWHSRSFIKNNYLLFISVPYLFIGLLDMLHTLSYPGMEIFTDYDFYANQLWIAARYMESITLLIAFFVIKKEENVDVFKLFVVYFIITGLIILSIFVWRIFPVCFIEGEGLTTFKKVSEYIISAVILFSIFLLYKRREYFDSYVYRYMMYSFFFTIGAELAFTFYIDNYGISNLIGHYFKLFSFYCIYRSVVRTGLEEPHRIIFHELVTKERRLQEANATKDKLFSILLHDLRGPIGGLASFLDVFKNDFDSYDKDFLRKFIIQAQKDTQNLYELLENSFSWARAQTGLIKPNIRDVDTMDLLKDTADQLSVLAVKKGIQMDVDGSPCGRVKTDPDLLITIVRNLAGNSLKYTPEGGKVTLACGRKGESVFVSVIDTGMGMSEKKQEGLFDITNKESRPGTDGEKGTGLGLVICREFADLLGGSLKVESEEGKGTAITLFLPVSQEA
ncbi:sensor histidine kinase [Limisalsivibrio acetivorans]|uniref:sensor histidine kinase n=1 Tax=Limisalsivibrio acetivorans TaxID=1304888 RepID=UPI0003B33488|nr:MASE3 domain-containing protein [Limisalsivibrio acetivorans]